MSVTATSSKVRAYNLVRVGQKFLFYQSREPTSCYSSDLEGLPAFNQNLQIVVLVTLEQDEISLTHDGNAALVISSISRKLRSKRSESNCKSAKEKPDVEYAVKLGILART